MSGIDRKIKRIPVKETTWRNLHELKEASQSYDELLAGMIKREHDWRDWKIITELERTAEYVAFDPDEILREDSPVPPVKGENPNHRNPDDEGNRDHTLAGFTIDASLEWMVKPRPRERSRVPDTWTPWRWIWEW